MIDTVLIVFQDNRIEVNLKMISRTMMVDLPQNQSFTLDQLVALQEKTIKIKSALVDQRNLQVERAVDDLADVVINFPIENDDLQPDTGDVNKLRLVSQTRHIHNTRHK